MPTRDEPRRTVERAGVAGASTGELVESIVTAVAEATDTPVSELETPLLDVVDPESLAALLASSGQCSVEFGHDSLTVVVDDDFLVASTDPVGEVECR